MPPAPSKAGIIASNNGERHIPSSTRADGTKRKEIKIRPGYEPPEDVEVYKNRSAEIWRDRGSGKIPGAEGLEDQAEGSIISNKNAKRREARKKAREVAEKEKEVIETKESRTEAAELPIDVNAEKEKKAKNLRKKIKQAKELRERKDCGTSLLPEQLAKVIKINELVRELQALGLNTDEENHFTTGESKD